MKNKIIMAFLFCLISSIANAQTFQSKKVLICDTAENIFSKLANDFNEVPIWGGKDAQDNSSYTLTVNPQTGAWTLLQYSSEFACVLGVGENSKLILGKNSVWHPRKDSNLRLPRS